MWPVLILAAVFILREPIKNLASSPRLKALKAGPGGVEIEFIEELGEVQRELAASPVPKAVTEGPIDKSGLTYFRAEMERLAVVSPRSVVMETHARLERLLREAVERNAEDSSYRFRGMQNLIAEASRQGWLPDTEASALRELSDLRNRVAHEPETAITPETALSYADVAAEAATVIHHRSGPTTADGPFLGAE